MKNGQKWVKQINDDYGKTDKNILKLEKEKVEQNIIHLKKQLHTIKKKKVKNYTIETKCDKFGNKVSMLET